MYTTPSPTKRHKALVAREFLRHGAQLQARVLLGPSPRIPQQWDNAMKQLKTTGRMHRLKQYVEAQLPVHMQYTLWARFTLRKGLHEYEAEIRHTNLTQLPE
jgi:hypothetical protein